MEPTTTKIIIFLSIYNLAAISNSIISVLKWDINYNLVPYSSLIVLHLLVILFLIHSLTNDLMNYQNLTLHLVKRVVFTLFLSFV
jgi:hypothetical protein